MQRIFRPVLFLTFVLCACTPNLIPTDAPTNIPSPILQDSRTENLPDSPTLPIPEFAKTLETPHIDRPPEGENTTSAPAFEGCAYQWAYQDLPELSSNFQQTIQGLQPGTQANAYAFGEDGIHADGTKTFLAKETDFNVTLQVNDLTNESGLGEWIVKVMQVIENIPQEQIVGPGPGLVRIILQSNAYQKTVSFYINQYQVLPVGSSNAEIYQALQTPQ